MSKLKQKYPTKKKAPQASRDDDGMDMDDPTDGDIIRCVCDDSDDDGFTIQCEHCENWQHASCVNIKKNNIPEHYMCDRCSRKLNKRDPQARRRNASPEADKKPKSKKLLKRAVPKKRVYPQDSDDDDSTAHHIPPTISKSKFTPLSKNVFKEKLVEHLLIEVHRQWMESNKSKSSSGRSKAESPSTSSSAAAAKGLESIVVMESNLLLPAIPKASVKPLRRSLRGTFLQNQKDPSVEKGVFADIHIPEHRYLMEVTGEYARKSEYKNDPDNNFTLLGTPPAHVFFFRNIDICINARFAGNDTRYIRRSCAPNSEIRGIILPNDSDDHTIHMGIYTTEEVDRGEEITIPWNWQRGHLMWNKNKEFLRQDHSVEIHPSEADSLKQSLSLIASEFGECACEDKEECLIECLKDELKKHDDDQHAAAAENDNAVSSSTKRKRLSNSSSGSGSSSKVMRPDINEHHKPGKKGGPRASGIFSSDEEGRPKSRRSSVGSSKEEHKQVKLIKKSTARRNPSNAPTSPTVSQADSVDIDILSMSPVPSQPASETESETQLPGYKRPRPLAPGDIRLPIKKRWLQRYLNEQREKQQKEQEQLELEQQQAQTSVEAQPQSKAANPVQHDASAALPASTEDALRDTHHAADQDDSSDGASSDSTLPLEDTPKTQQGPVGQQQDETTTVPDAASHSTAAALPQEQQDPTDHIDTSRITHSGEPESSSSHVYPIDNRLEQVKQAKKKLSLQEYLLMRRGNLPTPDEKHSSTG